MLARFAENLLEGYMAPRQSAERLLTVAPSWRMVIELAILAFALQTVLTAVTRLLLDGTDPGAIIDGEEAALMMGTLPQRAIQHCGTLGLVTILAYWIGRLAGGAGDLCGIATVASWHGVVTSLLAPLYTIAALELRAGGNMGVLMLLLVLSLFTLWLLANYISAAHRFESAVRVFFAALGIVLGFALLAGVFLSALVVVE